MSFNIPHIESDNALTVFIDGAPKAFPSDHPSFNAIRAAIHSGDEETIRRLSDVRLTVADQTLGRVQILDNTVLVAGREVTGRLVDRILDMLALGSQAVSGYIKFLDNLYSNPSRTAIQELYQWIESCDCPITPDGCLLAYRYVNNDFTDGYTGTVFQKPAADMTEGELTTYSKPVMSGAKGEVTTQVIDGITTIFCDRNEVDDVRDNHCSNGLHFCSYSYLPNYVGSMNILVVKINPADVVSIPSDYNYAKGRCNRYQVVSKIEQGLELTPIFTAEYNDDADAEEDSAPATEETKRGGAKLTTDQVREIKNMWHPEYIAGNITLTAIGDKYGVHREQIARIFRGDTWSEVT